MYITLKRLLVSSLVGLISKSYYFTQLARLVVRAYDNDGNADMYRNGEFKLLNLIASKRGGESSVFVDVGANVGDWSAALIGGGVHRPTGCDRPTTEKS